MAAVAFLLAAGASCRPVADLQEVALVGDLARNYLEIEVIYSVLVAAVALG